MYTVYCYNVGDGKDKLMMDVHAGGGWILHGVAVVPKKRSILEGK